MLTKEEISVVRKLAHTAMRRNRKDFDIRTIKRCFLCEASTLDNDTQDILFDIPVTMQFVIFCNRMDLPKNMKDENGDAINPNDVNFWGNYLLGLCDKWEKHKKRSGQKVYCN